MKKSRTTSFLNPLFSSLVKNVFLWIFLILCINIMPLFSQIGTVQVQSDMNVTGKITIQPQGDIGMGIFQPVSSPGTIVDTDGNGLSDAWEMQYFGHLGNSPGADPDNDGLTNLQEYQQGSNPMVPNTTPPPPALPPMAGMFAWYYGSEAYTDAGMQAKCTQGGTDACYTLKDLSGNGRNLVQATATKQPIYQAGQKPSVTFDGVDDELLLSSFTQSQPISIFMVAKAKSYSGSNQDWISLNSTGNGLRVKTDATNITVMSGAATGASTARPNAGSYYLIEAKMSSTASALKMGKTLSVTGAGSTLGASFIALGSGNNQRFSNLDVCEVIVYAGDLDPDKGDGLWVRQYLDAKYNFGIFSRIKTPPTEHLFARYDAAKGYQDLARTIPSSGDGDPIQVFEDLSGNNRHAVLPSGSNPSQYFMSQVNGNPVARDSQTYSNSYNVTGINTPSTIVIYMLLKSTSSTPFIDVQFGAPKASYSMLPQDQPNYIYLGRPDTASWISAPDGVQTGQWQLLVFQLGPQGYVKIDLANSKAISSSFSLPDLGFGCAGDFAEYLIYDAQHDPTAGVGLDVYRYFNSKYNLNFPLP